MTKNSLLNIKTGLSHSELYETIRGLNLGSNRTYLLTNTTKKHFKYYNIAVTRERANFRGKPVWGTTISYGRIGQKPRIRFERQFEPINIASWVYTKLHNQADKGYKLLDSTTFYYDCGTDPENGGPIFTIHKKISTEEIKKKKSKNKKKSRDKRFDDLIF